MADYYMQYPPLANTSTQQFITDSGITATGNMMDDFRSALVEVLVSGGVISAGDFNKYTLDDLWQLYIINIVSADSNAEAGNPAAAGRGKSGHVGNPPGLYYSEANRRDSTKGFSIGAAGFVDGADVPAAGAWTLSKTWTDGGANDHSPIFDATSATNLYALSFDPTGEYLITTHTDGGEIVSFQLSTPWDLSTASQIGTSETERTNAFQGHLHDDGTKLFIESLDSWYKYVLSTPYTVDGTGTHAQVMTEGTMGHTGTSDGAWAMDPAGTHVWKVIQVGSTWRLSCRALSTPWDLTSGSTNSIIDLPSPWLSTNAVFNSELWASADGTVLYHWYGNNPECIQRIALTAAYTPASGITVTRDTSVFTNGTEAKAAWAPNMTRMWTWNRIGTNTGSIYEYVPT